MKYAIIHADDLGWSPSVNRGIIKAFDESILTSTSILVNGPAYDDALDLVQARPGLGVGIHLNLLRGRPILPPVRLGPIVDNRGLFVCSIPRLLYRAQFSKAARSCMEAELSAQIEKALADGVSVTHIDSERHIHFFPPISRIATHLAVKYGITRVRHILKSGCGPAAWMRALKFPGGFVKERLLTFFCRINHPDIDKKGLESPDYLLGIAETGRLTAPILESLLTNLPDGVSEIMCHPGYVDEETGRLESILGPASINKVRELELDVLLQPRLRTIVDELEIHLINYGNLPSSPE